MAKTFHVVIFLINAVIHPSYAAVPKVASYSYQAAPVSCDGCSFSGICQHYKSIWWMCREMCLYCQDGKKYHCAKMYEDTTKFVDGCAFEKNCSKGEEPLLSFIKNQREVENPEVYCRKCSDPDTYNDKDWVSSSTYSECSKKYNICTQEKHKIKCAEFTSDSENYCRCDARNGYYPINFPDGPICSTENYVCVNYRFCSDTLKQELLLNYTCGPACETGFMRTEDSDECVPFAVPSTVESTAKPPPPNTTTPSVTRAPPSTRTTSHAANTPSPKSHENSSDNSYTVAILASILTTVVIVSVIVGAVAVWYRRCHKPAKKDSESAKEGDREVHKSVFYNIEGNYINVSSSRNVTVNQNQPRTLVSEETEIKKEDEASEPLLKVKESPIHRKSSTETSTEDSKLLCSMQDGAERKKCLSFTDIRKDLNLNDDEQRITVKKVISGCVTDMVKYLHPESLLDYLLSKGAIENTKYRDLMEAGTTTEKSRKIMQHMMTVSADHYQILKDYFRESSEGLCSEKTRLLKVILDLEGEVVSELKFKKNARVDETVPATLIPEDFKVREGKQFLIIKSSGDGNCLFNSVSLFIAGDESLSHALRQAVAEELSSDETAHLYGLEHELIKEVISRQKLTYGDKLLIHQMLIADGEDAENLTHDTLVSVIKREGEETKEAGRYCSMLQVLALASVLQEDIISLFPDMEPAWQYRNLYCATVKSCRTAPRSFKKCIQPIRLLWTGNVTSNQNSQVFRPNHVAPVVEKSFLNPEE